MSFELTCEGTIPDAAWTLKTRLKALSQEKLSRYWPIAPDFVIEFKSQTDRIATLRDKMCEWLGNGSELAWLVNPETRSVEIYGRSKEVEIVTDLSVVGTGPAEGLVLQLTRVWDPL